MATRSATFGNLPVEIVESILYYLSPEDLCDIRAVSRDLQTAADAPLLWRYHCRYQYRFWDRSHQIWKANARHVNDTDWKSLVVGRRATDKKVNRLMKQIVESPRDRIAAIEDCCRNTTPAGTSPHFYDVKDALLVHANAPEDEEDYLARRFWGKAVLERLQRSMAIEQWKSLRHQTVDLEKALGAFDMFIIGTGEGDTDDIHQDLDNLATKLMTEHQNFAGYTTRRQATVLTDFLKAQGYNGVAEEDDYHNLQNNFLSKTLRDPDHEGLPLVCVAIYCCVAARVGLFARPCSYPLHVYALVNSPEGKSLDGHDISPELPQERMYIDVFRSNVDVPVAQLQSDLRRMGIADISYDLYLGPAGTLDMTIRTSRNIMESVQRLQNDETFLIADTVGPETGPRWVRVNPDMDSAFYATLWAICLLHEHSSPGNAQRRQHLPFICDHFQTHCPWDAKLIQDHIAPFLYGFPEYNHLLSIIRMVRDIDIKPINPVPRNEEINEKVKWKVGQVFRHKRYGYEGVIVGWDTRCDADESWINQNRVDRLNGGRGQSFYHVLVDDKSSRYVAEENIAVVTAQPSTALMLLAGRYFKRYDKQAHKFVSNIVEEYPDD